MGARTCDADAAGHGGTTPEQKPAYAGQGANEDLDTVRASKHSYHEVHGGIGLSAGADE